MSYHITNGLVVKHVAGYVRVSTFEQAEKGTSIDEQKRLIREECQRRGWRLVNIYCDEGASGRLTDRRGLDELREHASAGVFSVIMFTKSDRLTRSLRDLSNFWHDWTKAGLEIICIEQPEINSEGLSGKMIRNLLGIFAEWERDTIIERTSSGRMARWRNYEAIIGTLPYGYHFDKHNRKIIFDLKKIITCKRIFKLYLDRNLSARDIAIRFTKESIPTPRGTNSRWQYGTVLRILKNTAYTGTAVYNVYKFTSMTSKDGRHYTSRIKDEKSASQWVTINFPPIISKKRFKQINELMQWRSSRFKKNEVSYKKSILLENVLLFCGSCGRKMQVKYATKNGMESCYKYYRCQLNAMSKKELLSNFGTRERCTVKIDAATLDNYVYVQVMAFFVDLLEIARNELANLSVQDISARMNIMRDPLPQKQISFRLKHDECENLVDWIVNEVSVTEFHKLLEASRKYLKRMKGTNKKQGIPESKYDLIDSSSGILRICSKGVIGTHGTIPSPETTRYIDAMSFDCRKQFIESVISPETGGKCILDIDERPDTFNATPPKWEKKRAFANYRCRKYPVTVEIIFYMSLGTIQKLIWGVGGVSLFDAIRRRK